VFHGRSWQAHSFGTPADVLHVVEVDWPAPSEGNVLVKVHACGVGLPDLLMVDGSYPLLQTPPVVPGLEVAGEVVAVPAGSALAVGDRVMGATLFLQGTTRTSRSRRPCGSRTR
jgi:NADPH:quinone reductase